MALNFYGYREENELYPYKTGIDAIQNALIDKKADAREVEALINEILDMLGKDLPAIIGQVSANTENIAELSGNIDTIIEEHMSDYVRQDEFCGLVQSVSCLSEYVSAETKSLWDAIDEISGDSSCSERIDELSGKVESIIEDIDGIKGDIIEINNAIDDKASLEQLNNVYESLSAAIETVVSAFTGDAESIAEEVIRATNAENDLRNMITSETASRIAKDDILQGKFDVLSGQVGIQISNLSNALETEMATREDVDDELSGKIETMSSTIGTLSAKVDSNYATEQGQISGIIEALENVPTRLDIEAISGEVETLQIMVNSKADKTDVENLEDRVEALETEVPKKANKSDLSIVSGAVDNLSTVVSEKASQSDLEAISEALDAFEDAVENEYAKKEYCERVYATKSETVSRRDFNDTVASLEDTITSQTESIVGMIEGEALARANADGALSESIATNVSNLNTLISTNTSNIEAISSTTSSHSDLIDENRTKIGCISALNGVEGSDTSGYDDSGNGILDVLHREFHGLMDDTYGERGISGLINYLTDLENRIKALENA